MKNQLLGQLEVNAMKIVCLKSFTILVVISLMINLSNTPTVKAGPASAVGCILGCLPYFCQAAKELCKFSLIYLFNNFSDVHSRSQLQTICNNISIRFPCPFPRKG